MGLLIIKKITSLHIILLATFLALFAGGIGKNLLAVGLIGLCSSSLLVIFVYFKNHKRIYFPRSISFLFIFLFFLAVNIFWSGDRVRTFNFFLSFLSGGLFYLSFFNLRKSYSKIYFDKIILLLSFIFTLIFIYYKFVLGRIPIGSLSLFLYTSTNRDHVHLGDLISISLLILTSYFLVKPKMWQILFFFAGLFFMTISLSRSAYLSFGLGFLYLIRNQGFLKRHKRLFLGLITIFCLFFFYATSKKSLLFARPFFAQALIGFYDNPFGVGVGNFKVISQAFKHGSIFRGYSEVVENFILELLVGMGVFVLPFVIWLLQIIKRLLGTIPKQELLYPTIFIALTINFMFDMTYYIPTMLWIWFICLGLGQTKPRNL